MKNSELFSQLLSLFSQDIFSSVVDACQSDYRCKKFTSWSHFSTMLYGQLSGAQSLNEIVLPLQSQRSFLKRENIHPPLKSTLATANERRSHTFFEELFYAFSSYFQPLLKQFSSKKRPLYSIDSSTIDLCLSLFDWADFRSTKGGVKLHLCFDHYNAIPHFALITTAKRADVKMLWKMPFEKGSMVVFDRAYNDYSLFKNFTEKGVFFVARAKSNCAYTTLEQQVTITKEEKITDSMILLKENEKYPQSLRLVKKVDRILGEEYTFITNNFDLSATEVAEIYKQRWAIELFFKEIKQNFMIKKFVGTSENAVKIQIWVALIASLFLKVLYRASSQQKKVYFSNMVKIIQTHLFVRKSLRKLIDIKKFAFLNTSCL